MTTNHLRVNRFHNGSNRKLSALSCDLRVEDDLKKKIAEFVAQFRRFSFARLFNSLERFVSLFQKHGRERFISLLTIPGAAFGRAKTRHQCDKVIECSHKK